MLIIEGEQFALLRSGIYSTIPLGFENKYLILPTLINWFRVSINSLHIPG